jgi:tetratricopeptide (TPR) repeat protein
LQGVALRRKHDLDGAIREQATAIRLDARDADAHRELGNALGEKGDWDGEIREEREAIRLNVRHAAAHNDLGIALLRKGITPRLSKKSPRLMHLIRATRLSGGITRNF